MQLPGSVWVTLPVPSCLDTSAPSLRPASSGKLSFPLRYSRLSLPHHPSSLLPNLGSLGPKHRAGTVVTEASQRAIWILTLRLQNAPGSYCKKPFYASQLGHPVEPTVQIKSPLTLASLVHTPTLGTAVTRLHLLKLSLSQDLGSPGPRNLMAPKASGF